jgi:hypothetical protein
VLGSSFCYYPNQESILQVSSRELLPALNEVFLIRSFVHHFYPAYLDSFVEYAEKSDPDRKALVEEEPPRTPKR